MADLKGLRIRKIDCVMSTDDIIPGRYKHMFTDTAELAKHVFENIRPGLAETFRPGDAIWSTATFGIGSSREQAVSSLLAAGVRAVIAPSFGRIFYRNAWNLGLVAIEASSPGIAEGDVVDLDLEAGEIGGPMGPIRFAPPPARMLEMVAEGGLLPMLAKRLPARAGIEHGGDRP